MSPRDLRALLVSYAFPPVGGAGVQRVLKFVKYLPSYEVTPSVLTVNNPSVPIRDESLARDVPAHVTILRARTFEPSYRAKHMAWQAAANGSADFIARAKTHLARIGRSFMMPDPQVLWLPAASVTLAARMASRDADDVVFISGPPFSQFILGALARLHSKAAIVLDYRDEWSTTHRYEMGSASRVNAQLERRLLRAAHAVTTATNAFRSELLARFDFLDPQCVHTIPNGYDPDDFPIVLPSPPSDRLVLTYLGTVFRLTSARGLVDAVRLLHAREPELAKLLRLRFIGRIVETEAAYFKETEALGIERTGYVEHAQAVTELARSHIVLCLLDDVSGADRIYPAKIFEIMYLRRPCLALAPEGELASLVREHALGDVVPPRDVEGIFSALVQRLRAFRNGQLPIRTHAVHIEPFHRRRQAEELARVFHEAVERARGATQRAPPAPLAVHLAI